MEVLEEKVEEEQIEEEVKALEISDTLQDVETEVSVEQVCSPSDVQNHFDWSSIDTAQLPASYKTNSLSEERLLSVAAHFLQQYKHLCPARQPLFLHPPNECGVQKFVSTTVRPTLLPYAELYDWDGCASFVSDFLTMEPLKCPLTLPTSLYSPTTILSCQRGNCFDFSVLLCSLLLGAGYDAYCVHGYATREMCSLDQSLELCPLLSKPQQGQVPKEGLEKSKKYSIKPIADLQNMFELQQEDKKKAEIEAAQKSKEREKEKEVEKPRADPWHGLRVHAWVLVLAGNRQVAETFFINPFTGNSHSTRDEHFLGIESIWNHRNFWVNMQDCRNGCKDLLFNLDDGISWEAMLSGSTRPLPAAKKEKELLERDEDDLEKQEAAMSFDMPPSWVAQLQLSPKELETRYFQGRKVTLYKKAKLEKWAPYLHKKGLVQRLTCYTDLPCTEAVEVREWFKHREDMLERREVNKETQLTTDYFSPGHVFHLKAHSYTSLDPEAEHRMEFYNKARADDLQRCLASATRLTEYFVGRADLLHLRHVEFAEGEKPKLAGRGADTRFRPIALIRECFHRNPAKPAEEDVAERVFMIPERKIHLTYHLEEKPITASKREFFQVAERDMEGQKILRTHEMCITYEVGSSEKGKSQYQLYKLFQKLSKEEEKLKEEIQQFEAEVLDMLKIREEKEAAVELFLPISDMEKDEKRKQQHEAMKTTVEEKVPGQEEQHLDYLAPFLVHIGHRETLSRRQALYVRESCLADLRQQLRHRLNIIQTRLEKATEELQQQQQWFWENRDQLGKEEEEDFLTRCSQTMFQIRIIEQRLSSEKQAAIQKYFALEEKLHKDPRLAPASHLTSLLHTTNHC